MQFVIKYSLFAEKWISQGEQEPLNNPTWLFFKLHFYIFWTSTMSYKF